QVERVHAGDRQGPRGRALGPDAGGAETPARHALRRGGATGARRRLPVQPRLRRGLDRADVSAGGATLLRAGGAGLRGGAPPTAGRAAAAARRSGAGRLVSCPFGLFWSAVLRHRFGVRRSPPLWIEGCANPKDPKRCRSTALQKRSKAVATTALQKSI